MLPLILKAVINVYVPRTSLHVKVISHEKSMCIKHYVKQI